MNEPTFSVDASDLVMEHRGEGWLYKSKLLPATDRSLFLDRQTPAYVDTNEMSATAVISTATPDRVQDILMPRGCSVENYAKNPVVLWSHGLDEGLKLPLGTSANPDDSLAFWITDDEVKAKCYFAKSNSIAVQIFQLVADKIVRATSVRETPVPGKSRQIFRNGHTYTVVDEWLLEEWSWCLIGVNPDALGKCLSHNRLDGRPIAEPIFKSLTAMMPEKKPLVQGFGDLKMADEEEKPKDPKETPSDEVATDPKKESADGGETAPEPEPSDPEQSPYGKQLIDATHGGLKSMCKTLTSALGDEKTSMMENKELRPELGDVNDQMKAMCKSLEGMHGKHYPHFKSALKSDDMDEPEEGGGEDSGDSEMKAFLAGSSVAKNQIFGVESDIQKVLKSASAKLSASEKKCLQNCINNLAYLQRRAKSYQPKPAPVAEVKTSEVSAKDQAEIDAAYAKLKSA